MSKRIVSGIILMLMLGISITTFPSFRFVVGQIEEWVPYVLHTDQVGLDYWKENSTSYMDISIVFPSSGFNISDWGTPHIVGSNVSVNAEIWRWTGIVLPVVITVTHTYTLGNLTTGEYFFKLATWGCTVKNITFTVPIIVPDDHPTIQEAINNANEGDRIYVRNGTYYENVVVNKSISLFGEDRDATILYGRRLGTVIEVIRDNVMITNLTISNSSGECPCSGIILRVVKDCKISGNNIIDNYGDGVYLLGSSNNNISKNSISGNDVDGIALAASSENNIFENNISTNGWDGVFIGAQSSNNNVYLNDIALNAEGICTVYASTSRIFHNSYIDNGQQASSHDSSTVWDDGYPSGGNYWSDYAGVDSDGDGIGDTPYIIDADNQDRYPLMKPWGVVSGNLQILKPANGSVIVGPVNVTFAIENTGCNIEFAKGDSSNRIDLEIEYALNQTHGWGIKLWSTSDHGLNLSSGEEYTQTIIYDPFEYEEAIPPDFIKDAPYGETTIRLVHWKQIDTDYSYGEFGMTEINVTLQPIDTTPPTITLLSPQNKTYTTTSIPLTFTPNETTSWTGYSLDNQPNVTITGNTTLTGLSEGTHSITVFANDTAGNMGASEIVYFTVALPYGPTAEFTVTPETADVGESVKFDASASLPGWNGTHGMPITEYRWDFGGSIKITASTPILYYSFISPGIYYVTLTVYAPGATPEMGSTTKKVTITAIPVGGCSIPIKEHTTTKPLTLYLAIVAILTVSFTIAKRRKKQQN